MVVVVAVELVVVVSWLLWKTLFVTGLLIV